MKINILLLLLFSFAIDAASIKNWDHTQLSGYNLDLNTLELRNRASCAKASLEPTKSALLLLDNSLLAKAAYRLAKVSGQDSDKLTKDSIRYFRKKVIDAVKTVDSALRERRLPLLPVLNTKAHLPSRYKDIVANCHGMKECRDLDRYIADLWINYYKYKDIPSVIVENYNIDNFHSKESYFPHQDLKYARLNCLKLKKFSPFQSQLFGTRPDRELLQKAASELKNYEENFGSCEDHDLDNLVVSTYQLDVRNVSGKHWNEMGFDYWNSIKIYTYWYLKNIFGGTKKFDRIIGFTDISDALLIIANGCGSLESPECSNEYVSKNVIREMAKTDFKKNALKLDVFAPVVQGAESDLLKDPFTAVNVDILDLKDSRSADKWTQRLFKNFQGSKSFIRKKLIAGISYFNILDRSKNMQRVGQDLQAYYHQLDLSKPEVKNDLYYLCTETYFASHEKYSFIKENIEIIKKTNFLSEVDLFFNELDMKELVGFYENITSQTREFCNSLDQKEIFNDDFEVEKNGFSQWYLDRTSDKKPPQSDSRTRLNDLNKENYISLSSGESFCASPSDCVRQAIKHTIQLSRAVHYSSTFWNKKGALRSGELFNPYAERTACKIYDPWFKSKAVMTRFFSDLGQAAISTFTPGALYTKFDMTPGHVTSFNKLAKDGKILIDANFEKSKVMMDLTADFGPLLGAPCAISVSGKKHDGYNMYHFAGLSVGMCKGNESNQLTVMSANNMTNSSDSGQMCASCRLNFESVSNSLSFFDYTIGPFYYLVRSVVRLYRGFKDPDNIARDWKINFKHLRNTYMKFGYIPKKCVRKLTKGYACLSSAQEEKAVSYWQRNYTTPILGSSKYRHGRVKLQVKGCDEPVTVRFRSYARKLRVKIPEHCEVK